jgi:sugar O-acyltransferase (sialic acid O-acetyltransferase NeuD family)
MTARPLAIVGAGGLGRETAEMIGAINTIRPTWHLLGFFDDDLTVQGATIGGLPVLGPVAAAADIGEAIAICTARPTIGSSRARISALLDLDDEQLPSLVHPATSLANSTVVGAGAILLAGVVATADVTIGAHVVVMPQTVLTHDDRIDDFVTIASGVRLGGSVHVEREAYLGAGANVREGVTIGAAALVGMGSVVLHDVPGGETWAGVPARPLDRPKLAPALDSGRVTA